jgi:REP element-mobilizing transposase RayT
MPRPERNYPARRALDDLGNRSNLVFVTVCTRNRKAILARADIHQLLATLWADASHWMVGRYVLMPDHLHLFCAPAGPEATNVRDWISYWKSRSAAQWPRPTEQPIWQREAWDRQIRQGESYGAKWDYVRHNPVRAGLIANADDWPYQGELNKLVWHEA